MLLEIEGKQYRIIISDVTRGIHIVGISNAIIELSVYHQIPRHELLTYLQVNHTLIQKEAGKVISPDIEWMEVQLFGKKYIIKADCRTKMPFLKGTTILASRLPRTPRQLERLKTDILRDQILEMVGSWEERLDFILNNILIKSLRISDYYLSKDKSSISYAKKLTDVDPGMLNYIIAMSIFDYLHLNEDQRTLLYEKYVKDWKYLMKVYAYEKEK